MRYLLQFIVMAGDILLFGVIAYVVLAVNFKPIILLIVVPALKAFFKSGGFEAWNPTLIKQFLRNAKEIGL